jgi:antitoxin MazE
VPRAQREAASVLDGSRPLVYIQCISKEKLVQTRIQRWGNSLGLRIPRSFAAEAGVEAGSEVDLSVRDGDLIVKPTRRRKLRLRELLRKVTSKNVHDEVDTGDPVGREVW